MSRKPQILRSSFNGMLKWAEKQLADPNSRYHSWEHAYRQWNSYAKQPDHKDADLTALHLAFYLASWGMFRGSSGLLQRDYKVFTAVVKSLKPRASEGWGDCMFIEQPGYEPNALAEGLIGLRDEVAAALESISPTPEDRRVSATNTLVSKILLNTLACVPAWDENVRRSLSRLGGFRNKGSNGFSPRFLPEFIAFAREHRPLLEDGQARLYDVRETIKFPLTRILDLYLWWYGRPEKQKGE